MNRSLCWIALFGIGIGTLLYWQFGQSDLPDIKPVMPPRTSVLPPAQIGTNSQRKPAERFLGLKRLIRVNVTPSNNQPLTIAVDGPFSIRASKNGSVLSRRDKLPPSRVTTGSEGLSIGDATFRADSLEIIPQQSPAIRVGKRHYRGRLRLHRQGDKRVVAVNVLPLGYYVASVINGEMPASFPQEARKAQAVIARTYALNRMQATRGFGLFDVYADSRSQRYLGYQYRDESGRLLAGETAGSRKLVNATTGLICTYQGKLFSPYYSAVCGGRTTAGRHVFKNAVPALRSVPCRWCQNAKRYRWTVRVRRSQAETHLRKYLAHYEKPFGKLQSIHPVRRRGASDEPPEFFISDGVHHYQFRGETFRNALPGGTLPSPRFSVRLTTKKLIVTGRGHGHGVGLCQWGAAGQAKAGRSFRDILRYYYRGADVTTLRK